MKIISKDELADCEYKKPAKLAKKFKKIWKYKPIFFCKKHNQKNTMKCQYCKKKICSNCEKKETGKNHVFKSIMNGEVRDYQSICFEKYLEIQNQYCKSNVVSYIDQQNQRRMLLFCCNYYLNDFDLEAKCVKRQFQMLESFYHMRTIKNAYLLIWRTHTIRMFEIKKMTQKQIGKLEVIVHDIEYFEKQQILVISSEGGGIYLMNMNLKLIRKIYNTEHHFFFEIDKLSQRHLLCSSIQPTIQQIYIHKVDIVTGQKEELFKKKTDHRNYQRLNFLLTMLDCNKSYRKIDQKTLDYVNKCYQSSYISKLIDNQYIILINFHLKRLMICDLLQQEVVQIISLPQNSVMYYYIYITNDYIVIPANDFLIYKRKFSQKEILID
ncbi:hypothetical protein ABPG74_018104 [Tetrahymena malaccensis]